MALLRFCLIFIVVLGSLLAPRASDAQEFDQLFQNFSSNGLTYNERRYLQAALAFEGHYVGLLDGDWGGMSQRAMVSYSRKEFQTSPEEWHTAHLAYSFYERNERDGWNMRHFSYLGMSVMLPTKQLITDPATDNLLNYRHRSSSLKVSVGRHNNRTANNLHEYTSDAHATNAKPYSVRKTNFAVTTATMRDGTKLYTRSNFVDGYWSTIMVSAKSWDSNIFQAVTSSITVGKSPALDITQDGKLIAVVRKVVAYLDQERREPQPVTPVAPVHKAVPAPKVQEKNKNVASSGTGFFVSETGHILTNAHVVDGCREIFVDGSPAKLVDASSDFDLALLQTEGLRAKGVAVFSASPAMLNSDVTAVGFPYAGLLGGMNVTRGSISSLKGLAGDDKTFQMTAPVQSGNSGGPLLAADGEVVGVVVSKLDATLMARVGGDVPQNVNFAIRGEIAKLFLAQNQVQPKLSLDNTPKPPEELAKEAALFTSFVECK